jgi:N-methylhydantoinase A
VPTLGTRRIHAVDMRYAGQSYSLSVPIPEAVREAADLDGLLAAFHEAHQAIYGFREGDQAVEAVTQRLSLIGEMPKAEQPALPAGPARPAARGERAVFHAGAWRQAAIFRREDFLAGSGAEGPAVIEQDDTTLWLPPGWRLAADASGLLRVERI